MANEMFLKLDGVTGEVTESGVEGYIRILSMNWGVQNTSSTFQSGSTGHSSGRATHTGIHMTKHVDSASNTLFKFSANGQHIASGEIVIRENTGSGSPETYKKYTLTDIFVESWSSSGSDGGDKLVESFSIQPGTHQAEYFAQDDASGAVQSKGMNKWDLIKNVVS